MDNQGAIKLASNAQFHNRTKHINIRYHFIRDAIKSSLISLEYLPTAAMVADIMTKPLPRDKHHEHAAAMGLQTITAARSRISAHGRRQDDPVLIN